MARIFKWNIKENSLYGTNPNPIIGDISVIVDSGEIRITSATTGKSFVSLTSTDSLDLFEVINLVENWFIKQIQSLYTSHCSVCQVQTGSSIKPPTRMVTPLERSLENMVHDMFRRN